MYEQHLIKGGSMNKKVLAGIFTLALALSPALGLGLASAAGEGHTPVPVCHWVPAHGGTYIHIVVDDDGASGNANLQGHAGHGDDIIGSTDCNID